MTRQSLTTMIGIGLAAGALIVTLGIGGASADEEHGRGRDNRPSNSAAVGSNAGASAGDEHGRRRGNSTDDTDHSVAADVAPAAQGDAPKDGPSHSPTTAPATATPVSPQPSPTAVSPQPSPTAVSPQPTPTAVSPQPTPTQKAGEASLEVRHGIAGVVTAISVGGGTGTLTISTANGLVATIQVTATTEIWGSGHDALTLGDIAVGDFVNVQGEPTVAAGDATLVARTIQVHAARTDHGAGLED